MSRKKITLADGQSVIVNFDGEPTQQDLDDAAGRIGQHTTVAKLLATKFPRTAAVVGPVRELSKEYAGGMIDTAKALPGAVKGLLSHLSPEAPPRDARAIAQALQHPVDTATRAYEAFTPETLKFILGAVGGDPTGIQPPSPKTVAREAGQLTTQELAGRAPGVVKRGARYLGRHIWGAPVALHEMALGDLERTMQAIKPSEEAVPRAFAEAAAVDAPPIWMGHLRKAARSILEYERGINPKGRVTPIMEAAQSLLDDSGTGWSPEKWKRELDRMGARLGGIGGTEGLTRVHNKEIGQLMEAMYRDIETGRVAVQRKPAIPPSRVYKQVGGSGTSPGANATMFQWVDEPGTPAQYGPSKPSPETIERAKKWSEAQRLARRRHGFNDLESMVNKPGVISVTGDQYKSLNINGVLREIDRQIRLAKQPRGVGVKRAKRFLGSFEPGELQAIRAKLDEIGGDLPRIPIGRGAPHGSGGYLLRAVIGETIGQAAQHPALGVAAGIAVPEMISRAVRTAPGRAAIKFASRIDPSVGQKFQQTLAALLRSQMQAAQPQPQAVPQPVPSPVPQPTRTPTLGDELLDSILKGGLMPNRNPEAYINAR